ncbi:MAG: NUDIX domain-containing protein [Tannerellaceae bacterium]|nr:NUDIX domain-containing protein [Tannerellaceae bacterium]MCD8264092.1 NUDIX domain-containing protein [Tannerellaceae bacterium]
MNTQQGNKKMLHPHVSVDCVLLGISNDQLCVLLVERHMSDSDKKEYKLPGSLIYDQEDIDDAAHRVLTEATGLKRVWLKQFRAFGSPTRTSNVEDMQWLQNAMKLKIGRLITVTYLALCKIGRHRPLADKSDSMIWCPVNKLPRLPFDHPQIVAAAVEEIRTWVEIEPSIIFNYLPAKFTAHKLRRTYEVIYDRELDVRNFHKKMNALEYIVKTDEMEQGVTHRAARFYRFDKVKYNQQRSKFNKN